MRNITLMHLINWMRIVTRILISQAWMNETTKLDLDRALNDFITIAHDDDQILTDKIR